MPRTAPPPKLAVVKKGTKEHGPVIRLTAQQIAHLSAQYAPPLTAEERAEKEMREANIPDTSHLTVWDPSTRR